MLSSKEEDSLLLWLVKLGSTADLEHVSLNLWCNIKERTIARMRQYICTKYTCEVGYMQRASSVFSILLLLLRDSSNFKIRIQAAAALAVPATLNGDILLTFLYSYLISQLSYREDPFSADYGRSFLSVLQGVQHVVESLNSDEISSPSNLKYRLALEKQVEILNHFT
ncbi:hypothetical protein BC332_00322 [Capsicum chinense]|nr:hypothetical protein BC332_00322 [Capsicum chinense]